ncbi:hypothetical protein V565_108860 [Rhizoctonia solani 123E]|uniref:Uncharacterized protein n=1 Tax=Rhizoctonia solani 123E TaxID=1423351 RepID=A0A074RUR3_9AGAM|nr:hypothetical protein V565_108860 [Rhizoctonia solani 123E]
MQSLPFLLARTRLSQKSRPNAKPNVHRSRQLLLVEPILLACAATRWARELLTVGIAVSTITRATPTSTRTRTNSRHQSIVSTQLGYFAPRLIVSQLMRIAVPRPAILLVRFRSLVALSLEVAEAAQAQPRPRLGPHLQAQPPTPPVATEPFLSTRLPVLALLQQWLSSWLLCSKARLLLFS